MSLRQLSWQGAPNRLVIFLVSLLIVSEAAYSEEVTLLHSWDSPGEAKAIVEMEHALQQDDVSFSYQYPMAEDMNNVPGIQELTATLNRKPTFLALNNATMRFWYDLGIVHSLTEFSAEQNWSAAFSDTVLEAVTYRDQVIAVPVNVHISNWVWANKSLIDATGLSLLSDWDEFILILDVLKSSGVVPIAHDDTELQDLLLFETLYLASFGADEYRQIFDDLNASGLREVKAKSRLVFERLSILKPYISRIPDGGRGSLLAQQLIRGQAALLIQGDWAQGVLAAEGGIANQHYYCVPFPGSFDTVSLKVDSIASLKSPFLPFSDIQRTVFQRLATESFNRSFNLYKGGLPARQDVRPAVDNDCSNQAIQRLTEADASANVVLSISQGMSVREAIKSEISAVVHRFMTSDMAPEAAAAALQKRMKYASYLIN